MGSDFTRLCTLVVVGAFAGWIAALILRGRGLGVPGNVVVGMVGALGAEWVLGLAGFRAVTSLAVFLSALGGATALLWLISRLRPRRRK